MIFGCFLSHDKVPFGKEKVGFVFQASQVEVTSQQAAKPQYTSLEKWIKSPGDPKYLSRVEYILGYEGDYNDLSGCEFRSCETGGQKISHIFSLEFIVEKVSSKIYHVSTC